MKFLLSYVQRLCRFSGKSHHCTPRITTAQIRREGSSGFLWETLWIVSDQFRQQRICWIQKVRDRPWIRSRSSAHNVISAVACHLHLDEGNVLANLTKFHAKDWKGEVWASAWCVSTATWWKGLCGSGALSPIASGMLQTPLTSAASERNWSLFGINKLANEKVEKLVAIRSKLTLL